MNEIGDLEDEGPKPRPRGKLTVNMAMPQLWLQHGRILKKVVLFAALYGPVLFAYLMMFYAAMGLTVVATNPRMWVKGFFYIVDLAPQYMGYAGAELWDEVKVQASARIR